MRSFISKSMHKNNSVGIFLTVMRGTTFASRNLEPVPWWLALTEKVRLWEGVVSFQLKKFLFHAYRAPWKAKDN